MKPPTFKLPKIALSRRERLFAIIGATIIGLAVIDRVVLQPGLKHTRTVRADIIRLEEVLAARGQLLRRRSAVERYRAQYQNHLRLAGPPETEIAGLLREIETLGRDSGLAIGEVKPLERTVDGDFQHRQFQIEYEGTLTQWIRFVHLLERSGSRFEIDRATLGVKEQGEALLKGSLRLSSTALQSPHSAPTPGRTPGAS